MQKIASEAEWNAYCEVHEIDPDTPNTHTHNFNQVNDSLSHPWWAYREQYRLDTVYRTTEVTAQINKRYPAMFVHVSETDTQFLAFTLDRFGGEQDKQVISKFDRFLDKYYPMMSDDAKQQITEQHFGELQQEIRFYKGEALTEAYKAFDGTSLSSCMSHPVANYKSLEGRHPTEAFQTDHISLAVLYRGDAPVARTLVYEEGTKKVFIRAYGGGATALRYELTKAGYELGDMIGAKLKTIKLSENSYVVPYIDGQGKGATSTHSYVAVIDNVLTVLTFSQGHRVRQHCDYTGSVIADSAYGHKTLVPTESVKFIKTCVISGATVNLLTEEGAESTFVTVFHKRKQHGALHSAIDHSKYQKIAGVYYPIGHVKEVGGSLSVSTRRVLRNTGHIHIGGNKWAHETYVCIPEGETAYVYKTDCAKVFHYAGGVATARYYKRESFNARKFLLLADGDAYCTKDSEYLLSTSGKRLIPDVSAYYTDIEGKYHIRKPAHSLRVRVWDGAVTMLHSTDAAKLRNYEATFRTEQSKRVVAEVLKAPFTEEASRIFSDYMRISRSTNHMNWDMYSYAHFYARGEHYSDNPVIHNLRYLVALQIAEATAIDYNL